MAKILKIITEPSPILRKQSTDFDFSKTKPTVIKQLMEDMIKTMHKKDGVGLAAPQIGKNVRIIVINTEDGEIFMINPVITKKSFAKEMGEEGCLSVPGIYGDVNRHKKISCNFTSVDNKKLQIEAKGLLARVIQHELDHLDGILFIDKAKNLKAEKVIRPSKSNESKN